MKKNAKHPVLKRLRDLYARMDQAYDASAKAIGLSCDGCTDSCCETLFRHHTYAEWMVLWEGFAALPEDRRQDMLAQAETYVRIHQNALPGTRPRVPCPASEQRDGGLVCGIYAHRPMVCRLHGVPNVLHKPGGETAAFPGCDRAQQRAKTCPPALLDRTPLLSELARLEMDLLGQGGMSRHPRVNLTIAEMLLMGPPKIKR
ncbi:Putative zinc- or iron-chelating domain-containing protein [Humidesulfovibrio mexicanus]|uniref:Putative zinc- or iron-chelating domain-containing protein n=1 Tax=Humidesulfovibrio mexicanus TaxID=147047 RepID=A0A238YXD8_9BACT|nr:YkgJ family cysteine cluster protein [Humidesulfovibrio mexicanus]SNR75926.1 Putative zinc- or iron-chelating domain-containing protein [Humidesulfovibrio mexicanus]